MSTFRYAVVAVVAAIAAGSAVEAYHQYKETQGKKASKKPGNIDNNKQYSEELIREQLARNYAFLTEEGMAKLRKQRIVVVGVGGVGLWVATMLVRSGVETLRIVDFDQVSLSSLNRHAVAKLADVGTAKTECLRKHLLEIAPWVTIETRTALWNETRGEELLLGGDFNPTLVVDCIDNIDSKVDLLAFCHRRGLKVISSGGAACKSDPTRINIGDISKTEEDRLSKQVRVRLTKRGILTNIPVVFSAEKPDPRKAQLLPLQEDEVAKGDVDQLAALSKFRVRILPVLGTMPGMFGLALATHIITTVAGYPVEYVEGKNRYRVYDGLYHSLSGQEARMGNKEQFFPISIKDVPYILEEVFRGKSVVSNHSTRLTLSRWDPKRELSCQNVVVMTKDEQTRHEARVLRGGEKLEDVYDEGVLRMAKVRFEQERYYSLFR